MPVRFVFESALELMSETRVGGFEMKGDAGGGIIFVLVILTSIS